MHGLYQILSEVNFGDIKILNKRFTPFNMMQKVIDFGLTLHDYQFKLYIK